MENKALIKLVVVTEAVFFLSLIMAFVYMNYSHGYEPHSENKLDIKTTGFFTLFLLLSSCTFWMTEKSFKKGKIKHLKVWLSLTILFGLFFLLGQGREYARLIHEQITLQQSVFGSSFYTLTGFHGLHVLIGLFMLIIVLILSILGDFNKPGSSIISVTGIYWHFVDIVWIIVFTIVYALPYFIKK